MHYLLGEVKARIYTDEIQCLSTRLHAPANGVPVAVATKKQISVA